jgi:hypothetical protein
MNDDDLITSDVITTVREPFAGVRMNTPVDVVIGRGRSIRQHRRRAVSAAGAAVAAALALVIFMVLPAMNPAPVKLAAWTVTTEPGGIVAVTIHDLRDPAGLQQALQAHGVPAIVRFHPSGAVMPSCITSVPSRLAKVEGRVFVQPPAGAGQALLYIDPAAVPGTYQVAIDAVPGQGFSIGLLTHDGRCPPGSSPGGAGIRKAPAGHRQH